MLAKLRAWLVLTRGSNLPTVWSNLVGGWLLGYVYTDRFPWATGLLVSLFGLLLGVSLIYVGGMILNDAFDARWDTERRSTRSIPAGIGRTERRSASQRASNASLRIMPPTYMSETPRSRPKSERSRPMAHGKRSV